MAEPTPAEIAALMPEPQRDNLVRCSRLSLAIGCLCLAVREFREVLAVRRVIIADRQPPDDSDESLWWQANK